MSFGVLFTCYKEVEAVDFSIQTLRYVYPDVPVYLVSDGGSDFSFLEQKYNKVKTRLESDSRGISQGKLGPDEWKKPEIQEKIYDSIFTFFRRNIDAINYCNTKSILIMEPDVIVRGALHKFPTENEALLGSLVNCCKYPTYFKMLDILKEIPGSTDAPCFGSTPAFYNVAAMYKVVNFCNNNKDTLKKFISTDENFVCYDFFLTFLFAACGFREIYNPDIIECLRDAEWETKINPLVHQFRRLYPSKESGYDGRHS